MPNDTELVEVVARAICVTPNNADSCEMAHWTYWIPEAEAAISAARPIIEREVLEALLSENAATFRDNLPSLYLSQIVKEFAKSRNISLGERE